MTHPTVVWITYVAFVVYGSLVPLDLQPLSLDRAWTLFSHISWLSIDLEGRADWIANGVLYVPVGFLTLMMFVGPATDRLSLTSVALALLGTFALAVGVEFAQLFFPPRTVSLNDVIAEWVGTSIGAVVAVLVVRGQVDIFSRATRLDARQLVPYLTTAYVAAYLIVSLFPYDFLVSSGEIDRKINSDSWGWFLAAKTLAGGGLAVVVKLAAEALVVVPFGLLLGQRSVGRQGFPGGFALGMMLGIVVESAQWFVFSGISQGASVLTRAVGVGVGAVLWRNGWDVPRFWAWTRRMAPGIGLAYLVALPAVNGWFSRQWGGAELAAQKLTAVRFVPFYYHYYTSEAVALVSVVSVCLMYAPIGLLAWALRASPATAAMAAALAAFAVEVGKLFINGAHPDPTDLLVAGATAWLVVAVANLLDNTQRGSSNLPDKGNDLPSWRPPDVSYSSCGLLPESCASSTPRTSDHGAQYRRNAHEWRRPSLAAWAGLFIVAGVLVWSVASFPVFPGLLGLALLGYGTVVWRHPAIVVAVVPAALPVLDLAPWSGRFFFDEFDMLLAVSLAVGYARVPVPPRGSFRDRIFLIAAALVAVSYLIGCLRGVLPWQAIGPNSFTNYYSPFNALRIAKGALWAFLLYGLLYRISATGRDTRRLFAWGMVIGLAGTVAVILWERLTFSGPFNFSSDYRVTGPFSQLHTGGAYIEGFLTTAVPFLILVLLQVRSVMARTVGISLLGGATYALMVTFSRNGYVAFASALVLVFAAALAEHGTQWRSGGLRRGLAVLTLLVLALTVAMPIFKGEFSQARMSQVDSDLQVRQNHWADALRIRDPDLATAVLGMGIGRYPETHYWRSAESNRSAPYRIGTEDGNSFLRIGSGNAIYMEQFVAVSSGRNYLLSIDARAQRPDSRITVPICEKWLLTSYECAWQSFELGPETGKWQHFEKQIATENMAGGHWFARRPVRLTLHNSTGGAAVDVDNVHLASTGGADLVSNGDFSHRLDHWFFSTDSHLPWHIKNMWLSILFDQGWFGVVALGLFVAIAVVRAAGRAWQGSLWAGAVLAAVSGFLVVGVFDSLVDTPRFLMLLLLLAGFMRKAELHGPEPHKDQAGPPSDAGRQSSAKLRT